MAEILPPSLNSAMRLLSALLESRTGHRVSPDRYWRIQVALTPIMKQYGISDLEFLVKKLLNTNDEHLLRQALEAMLNNESYFFRDKLTFGHLRDRVLPWLHEQRSDSRTLRIWSAGCSTGQEIYSVVMLLRDQWSRWKGWDIELVGTDISFSVLEKASAARYPQFDIQRGLTAEHMLRYFCKKNNVWQLLPQLRHMVEFQQGNILESDDTNRKFDLILCRNVLMYFSQEMRQLAYQKLSQSIADDGLLVLGSSETIAGQTHLFAEDKRWHGFYGTRRQSRPDMGRCALG